MLRRIISGLVISVMVLVSIGLGLYGADHLTQATLGVGVLCAGVLVAVLARTLKRPTIMPSCGGYLSETKRELPP